MTSYLNKDKQNPWKGRETLIVSLSDINQGLWPHLRYSWQNATIFSYQWKYLLGCTQTNNNKMLLFPFLGSLSTSLELKSS